MNGTIRPLTVNTRYDENGTAYLEAKFGTGSLISLLANQTCVKTEIITLSINGTTKYGYFFGNARTLFNYTKTQGVMPILSFARLKRRL